MPGGDEYLCVDLSAASIGFAEEMKRVSPQAAFFGDLAGLATCPEIRLGGQAQAEVSVKGLVPQCLVCSCCPRCFVVA